MPVDSGRMGVLGGRVTDALRSSGGNATGSHIDPDRATLHPLATASLGNVAKNAATRISAEKMADRGAACRARFSLQNESRRLIPHERVARCLRYIAPKELNVEVLHSATENRAHFGNLEVCSSVWLCPVCAAKVAEGRRQELVQAIGHWRRESGGTILVAAFTVRHGRADDLQALLDRFIAAYRRLTGHRGYRALREAYRLVGAVRALEVTHGESNGWHPHYHVLLFFDRHLSDAEITAFQASLYRLWAASAARESLDMDSAHGLVLQRTFGAVADYVAKYGRDPKTDPWGPESEMTKAHIKQSRAGSTPWELLRRSVSGDVRAGFLYREYAGVFKGRQQLVWSPHFRAALGLADDPTDSDIASARPHDAVSLGWLSLEEWHLVLRFDARADVLLAAASGSWAAVLGLVAQLRKRRRDERQARGLEPVPPPIVPPPVQMPLLGVA